VGGRIGRIVEGCAAYRCAVTAARSRALTMTNFARSSLALVLRAVFGGAKSCALVKLFMICPPVGSRQSTMAKFLPLDRGYLMAIKPSKLGTQSWNWGPKLRSDSDCSRPTSTGGPRGATPGPDFEKGKEKSAKRLFVSFFSFLNLTLTRFSRVPHGKGMLLAVLETPRLPHCPGVRWDARVHSVRTIE
jgi:hypothetical protein